MTAHCPACNTPWTDHLGIAGTCARLKAAEQERDKMAEQLWSARNAFEALARGACGAPPSVQGLATETMRKLTP